METDSSKITITDNEKKIKQFINDLIIAPRKLLLYWSDITNQTPSAKIGYIGQHLASLITGVKGTRSGARGDDLEDGTEVKSCNKTEQVDICDKCKSRVMRHEKTCPKCGSSEIKRRDDSKWLFSVRDEHELKQYLNLDRVFLLLFDYPGFDKNDFSDIRISAFEIYPKNNRMKVFCDLISNHYNNIYKPKAKRMAKTNPMNLHPWLFQFYKCNPILMFQAVIKDIDNNPDIEIQKFVLPESSPHTDMETIPMPSHLLKSDEWDCLLENLDFDTDIHPFLKKDVSKEIFANMNDKEKSEIMPSLNERQRDIIPLRKIVSVTQKEHYTR